MAITSLTFAPSLKHRSEFVDLDYEMFETAIAQFEQGNQKQSVTTVFAHLFPKLPAIDFAKPFSFVQGSSRVTVTLSEQDISIVVPLVKLPSGGGAIAALRFLLTKISGSGQLHQPRLRGDDVYLEFRDKVASLHPAKLVEVLKRMPVEADNNDDWLIGQFGAIPLEREPIAGITDEEFVAAEAMWKAHWNDVEELVKESQRKRSMFFLNEMSAYAYYRIRYALPLSGFLMSKLSEHTSTFNSTDEDPTKREATLAKCAKEMKAVTAEQLRKDLCHPVYAISPHAEGESGVLTNYFGPGDYFESIEKYRSTGKSIEAAMALISTFTFLLGRYAWPTEVDAALQGALAAASGKPWREAANILAEHAEKIIAEFGDDEEEDEDGDDDDDGDKSSESTDNNSNQGGN
jgi:hypothetical protein